MYLEDIERVHFIPGTTELNAAASSLTLVNTFCSMLEIQETEAPLKYTGPTVSEGVRKQKLYVLSYLPM